MICINPFNLCNLCATILTQRKAEKVQRKAEIKEGSLQRDMRQRIFLQGRFPSRPWIMICVNLLDLCNLCAIVFLTQRKAEKTQRKAEITETGDREFPRPGVGCRSPGRLAHCVARITLNASRLTLTAYRFTPSTGIHISMIESGDSASKRQSYTSSTSVKRPLYLPWGMYL